MHATRGHPLSHPRSWKFVVSCFFSFASLALRLEAPTYYTCARSFILFALYDPMPNNKLGTAFWGNFYRIDNESDKYSEEKLKAEVASLGVQTELEQAGKTIDMDELRTNLLRGRRVPPRVRRAPRGRRTGGRRARSRREGKQSQRRMLGSVAAWATVQDERLVLRYACLLCVLCVKFTPALV